MKDSMSDAGSDGGERKPMPRTGTPVVGIGASAGGIAALTALIPAIPKGSGLAYVVVQHLDPGAPSALTEILGRAGSTKVSEITDGMPIEPDHIYVIPPNASLRIDGERLRLTSLKDGNRRRTPIDDFFLSLADGKGEYAACVILSGTGSDGTLGLRAVKEHGGLALAQAGAEFDGMMRSALATGVVDFTIPVEEIPRKLSEHFGYLRAIGVSQGSDGVRQEVTDHLADIWALLRTRTGHDFSNYKHSTVMRRIQRRMQVLQISDFAEFTHRLRQNGQEIDALFQDLLIGVTNFFRDPKCFESLEREVIPRLFEGKGGDDSIRVWVPGCSTGEEAFSIAMLLRECMPRARNTPRLQIFATDIDERSLHIARTGRYPATIAEDIKPELLERHFVREDGTYRIIKELREICLFAEHNLLRDAPISKLDLISCRNLLIYLTPELQNRIIPLFHYALKDPGYLFLGTSENVTRHPRLFAPVDKVQRVFKRRPQVDRRLPEFPLTAPRTPPLQRATQAAGHNDGQQPLHALAERQILDKHTPAYAIISDEGELLHTSGRTGKYLELAPGVPRTDIFSMARTGLRPGLRLGIQRAMSTRRAVVQKDVMIETDGGRQTIDLVVQPLLPDASEDASYLVVFRDRGGFSPEAGVTQAADGATGSAHHLEAELRATRERLQTATEELESSNEELKSGNEELSSMNEELQAANEELETSKEELQSMNEELQTVNAELNARVEELGRANSDIANLLESTQIATVFLDRSLAVKTFTPVAKDLFHFVESDSGRPITHLRARFVADTVREDAERVLRTLSTIERQVVAESGTRYVMRMMPYRTVEDAIGGVVLTFVDVTRITEAEARIGELTENLRHRVQSLETLLDLLPVGIVIIEDSRDGKVQVNQYGANLIGQKAIGTDLRAATSKLRMLDGDTELDLSELPLQRAIGTGETIPEFEGRLLRPDGSSVDVMFSATPLLDDGGKARGAIAAIVDITARKQAEEHRQVLLHELQHRVKNVLASVAALAQRLLRQSGSLQEFSEAFLGRLRAMATTHEFLSDGNWRGAGLRSLAEATLASHVGSDSGSIRIDGPDIGLAPSKAATLGMIFHELATNAAKYGALSNRNGRIDVSWKINGQDADGNLVLSWVERDGPTVSGPFEEGFGSGFVRRIIEHELRGRSNFDFEPAGLRCTIEIPLRRNVQQEGPLTEKE